jgi:hypothetical protein
MKRQRKNDDDDDEEDDDDDDEEIFELTNDCEMGFLRGLCSSAPSA